MDATTDRHATWRSASCIALVVCFALLSAELSFKLRWDQLDHMFRADLDALRGRALITEFQNRLIGPSILYAARSLAPAWIDDGTLWRSTRVLQAVASYFVLYLVAWRISGSRLRAMFAVGLITYTYLWTVMTSPYELSSDFFDIAFVAVIVALARAERFALLALVVVIASANRESAAFSGIIWIAIAGMRYGWRAANWRKFLPGVVLTALSAAVVLGMRIGLSVDFQPRQFLGIVWTFQHWRWLFSPFASTPMLIATAFAFVLVLRRLPRPWLPEQKGLLLAAFACAAITSIFGVWFELRVWMPSWTMLTMLAIMGTEGRDDREWLLGLLQLRR